MADSQKQTEENMRTKINELLFKFEENLANFLATSEQKSFEAINLELKSARELIESYKVQQLAIIDENIVSVLEKTLDLVLTEKLSLRNQVDLVYDALYKAKVEKFLV
jgi:guanylate kinase